MYELVGGYDEETTIEFYQWTNTDRANLVTFKETVPQYISMIIEQLEKLSTHSYIAKSRSSYLKQLKDNLQESQVIILGDFAENYSFVVQDEVQGFHWNNLQCTLHPAVVYYKNEGELKSRSYCMISDDNRHDGGMVYQVQVEIMKDLKKRLPHVTFATYFSDGCAGQHKNCKNLINLCYHKCDFDVDAKCLFFFCHKPWQTAL